MSNVVLDGDSAKELAMIGGADWPSYPKYKVSCAEWPKQIPSHWQAKRLRFTVKTNPVKSELKGYDPLTDVSFVPMEAVGEYGGLNLEEQKPLEDVSSGYTYFRDGDVLVAKITPCFENGKGVLASGLTSGIGFGTTELHVVRPDERGLDRHFLFYLSISHTFRKLGEAEMYGAGGQKRIAEDFIKDYVGFIPPLEEQRVIATFLDQQTARIDALIAKKLQLIDLLKEKRTALISQAVTKGLDLDVAMIDSGVEWLGKIPAHWKVKRLKYFVSCNDQVLSEATPPDYHIQYVKISAVTNNKGIETIEEYDFDQAPSRARRRVRDGDTILSTVRTYLKAVAPINKPLDNLIVSTGFAVIRPKEEVEAGYLSLMLQSEGFIGEVVSNSVGVSYPAINPSKIMCFFGCLPPLAEQTVITTFLNREVNKIDRVCSKVGDAIGKLKEYRSALISEAVTGMIDVRQGG